jgi:hypothetical protein
MFATGMELALAAGLRESRDELDFSRRRVLSAAQLVPGGHSSGWLGPAALAYRHSLTLVDHDLQAAAELLRSASDLTSAALYELGDHD